MYFFIAAVLVLTTISYGADANKIRIIDFDTDQQITTITRQKNMTRKSIKKEIARAIQQDATQQDYEKKIKQLNFVENRIILSEPTEIGTTLTVMHCDLTNSVRLFTPDRLKFITVAYKKEDTVGDVMAAYKKYLNYDADHVIVPMDGGKAIDDTKSVTELQKDGKNFNIIPVNCRDLAAKSTFIKQTNGQRIDIGYTTRAPISQLIENYKKVAQLKDHHAVTCMIGTTLLKPTDSCAIIVPENGLTAIAHETPDATRNYIAIIQQGIDSNNITLVEYPETASIKELTTLYKTAVKISSVDTVNLWLGTTYLNPESPCSHYNLLSYILRATVLTPQDFQ